MNIFTNLLHAMHYIKKVMHTSLEYPLMGERKFTLQNRKSHRHAMTVWAYSGYDRIISYDVSRNNCFDGVKSYFYRFSDDPLFNLLELYQHSIPVFTNNLAIFAFLILWSFIEVINGLCSFCALRNYKSPCHHPVMRYSSAALKILKNLWGGNSGCLI